jgi:SAM-dependent methyltransferase
VAANLPLESRIRLERTLTDSEARTVRPDSIVAGPTIKDYCNRLPWRESLFEFLGPLEGRTILDLGCGYHPTPIYLALAGCRRVYACDVSPRAVESMATLAENVGVSDRVKVFVAAAEALPLETGSLDLVHGESVLHHLDLELAGAEIRRVLKGNGRAAFKDPLGQNPLLELARDYLPYSWKKPKGTDRPLKFPELERFGRRFSHFQYRGFGLVSMFTKFLLNDSRSRLHQAAHGVDSVLLHRLPFLQRYCRFVVTGVVK